MQRYCFAPFPSPPTRTASLNLNCDYSSTLTSLLLCVRFAHADQPYQPADHEARLGKYGSCTILETPTTNPLVIFDHSKQHRTPYCKLRPFGNACCTWMGSVGCGTCSHLDSSAVIWEHLRAHEAILGHLESCRGIWWYQQSSDGVWGHLEQITIICVIWGQHQNCGATTSARTKAHNCPMG